MVQSKREARIAGEFDDPLKNYRQSRFDDPLEQALAEVTVAAIPSRPFMTIGPDAEIQAALRAMVGANITCLLVAEGRRLVGILSERDVLNKIAGNYEELKELPVREVMTTNPIVLYETDSLASALCVMSLHGFRHVPVLDLKENIVGIVSPQRVTSFLQEKVAGASN